MENILITLGEELTPIILNFVVVLVTLLFGYLGKKAGKLFDNLSERERVKTVIDLGHKHKEIVQSAVEFAEQVGKQLKLHGEEKFNLAKETAIASAQKEGIDISTADIDMLIESAVNAFNGGFSAIRTQEITTDELYIGEAKKEQEDVVEG